MPLARKVTSLKIWFWVLYILGPLSALLVNATAPDLVRMLPSWSRPWARMVNDMFGIWAPVICGAMGAAYCMARLRGNRSSEETLAFTILGGVVVTASYFVLLFVGGLVAELISALVGN